MNNGWLKLAVFAFVGILLSVVVLGLTSSNGLAASGSSHTQHQQASIDTNGSVSNSGMAVQGTDFYGNTQMSQMQGMNFNNNMQTNNNFYMIQQQMMQMQNQLNMMQQQMANMNNQNMNRTQ